MSDDPMMPIGYRSYRMSQLVDPQVVKRLRDLDVPLRAVAEIVQARDPEVTQSVIADHEQMMREHLVDLARLVDDDIAGEVARVIDLGATHIHDTAEFGSTGPLSPTPKATSSSSAARTTDRPSANSVTALWNSPRWSREPRCDPNTPDRGGGTSAVTLRHVVHTHHDLTGQDGLRPVHSPSSLPGRHGRRDGR